ncbi:MULTISPECIES: NAD(P)/FAD-dependent oxidoreductase [Clostridium]|uniref:NAD(P)/FAD-dependent oxidoreductase n=1 Tax=Clostridium TaxID=1485 RepID=UPI000826005D|nr:MULTISPECIES: NAD(P)/FAD-dependent oxidoreductase [Clostridium]PJI07428.1 NAD(P)/FAD-dependent oxidoreductase [Clostridium sp. CT7]
MEKHDLVVIGGGVSGLAAAISAKKSGIEDIVLIELEDELGGILNQCIHNGFGKEIFKEELTGTEYVQKFIDEFLELNITYKLNTMVTSISNDKVVNAVNEKDGIIEIKAKSIIWAAGALDKMKKNIRFLSNGLSGIYSAVMVQKLINVDGYMPGKSMIILGANKIGVLLAKRIFLEGGKVKAVIDNELDLEKRDETIESLAEVNIPFLYDYKVVRLKGKDRLEGVYILARGEEKFISCDTLILASKLLPNDKLIKKANIKKADSVGNIHKVSTNVPGIFIVGNSSYIHEFNSQDIVLESYEIGEISAEYVNMNEE